jgi:ABC-type amino acid transport substrate-binding protein
MVADTLTCTAIIGNLDTIISFVEEQADSFGIRNAKNRLISSWAPPVSWRILNMDFGALIPALKSGKVDMIGACITITEERAKSVLFSEPCYTGGIAALVRKQ